MANAQMRINSVRRAAALFRATRGRRGMVVELDDSAEDVLVAGDLHGNLAHFQTLLDRARLDKNLRRHLVLQELVHGQSRYPSGGCKSHQLVDLVAALKGQYPDRVHLILGNHELSEVLGRQIIKAGVRTSDAFRNGVATAYGQHEQQVFAAYLELFRALPLAVRTLNRIFISHSTPEAADLEGGFDPTIFQARSLDELSGDRADSLYALVWGRDGSEQTARRFTELVSADLLITGHMPCPDGFHSPNPLQLILDSSRFPACYCLVPNHQPATLANLVANVHHL